MLLSDLLTAYNRCASTIKCGLYNHDATLLRRYARLPTNKRVCCVYMFAPNQFKLTDDEAVSLMESHGVVCLPLLVPDKKEMYATVNVMSDALVRIHSRLIAAVDAYVKCSRAAVATGGAEVPAPPPLPSSSSTISYLLPNVYMAFSVQRTFVVMNGLRECLENVLYAGGHVSPIPDDMLDTIEKTCAYNAPPYVKKRLL